MDFETNDLEPEVVVLMATYNGEAYVAEQIDSIINQTYNFWRLIIRDDGSTDSTVQILSDYANIDDRIEVISDNIGNIGQLLNFNELMKNVNKAQYIMFCDQDDWWYPTKIECSVNLLISKEEGGDGKKIPCMVYSNFEVVDAKLQHKYDAYISSFQYDNKEMATRLLVQNWIYGCTLIINRQLLEYCIPVPLEAENHDRWVATIASLVGEIHYLNDKTVKHRLHSNNVTTREDTTKFKHRLRRVANRFCTIDRSFEQRVNFASILKDHCLRNNITKEITVNAIEEFDRLLNLNGLRAIIYAISKRFYSTNKIQTFIFFIELFCKN